MSQKETQPQLDPTTDDDVATIKKIESRISQAHNTQLELISSLPSLIPSLSLSLSISSSFNSHRPFDPLPNPNPKPTCKRKRPLVPTPDPGFERERESADDSAVLRSMVAVCLMESVPFEPIDSVNLLRKLEEKDKNATVAEKNALGGAKDSILAVETALRSMAEDNNGVELGETLPGGKSRVKVVGIDRTRLLKELPESRQSDERRVIGPRPDMWSMGLPGPMRGGPRMMMMVPRGMGMGVPPMQRPLMGPVGQSVISMKVRTEEEEMKELEDILNKKSFKEMQKSKTGAELLDLIRRPTAKENAVAAKFKSKGGSQVKEYCTALTKEDCRRQTGSFIACEKVHFRRIIALHTDMNLGDCSFLDTCRHMKTCKYVHYELDNTQDVTPMMMGAAALGPPRSLKPQRAEYCSEVELGEPQWINCDIRNFRMDILGQFGVIMADPPWDIHMELPYGTMADDEMRTLNVPALQTDGLIFLWVTGRAMELGRECLEHWGYKRCEEIIWVKTNQLQRIIRTGRTGHWLNHSKEHCLVGIKGDPLVNRNIDTDVLVAEVRETSRKPDEMYPLLERISPRTRKLELFARMHNTQAGWMSLGNQLSGVRLVDDGLRARFKAAYPEVEVQPASPPRVSTMEADFNNNNNNNNAQNKSPFTTAADSKNNTSSEQKPMNVEIEMTS